VLIGFVSLLFLVLVFVTQVDQNYLGEIKSGSEICSLEFPLCHVKVVSTPILEWRY